MKDILQFGHPNRALHIASISPIPRQEFNPANMLPGFDLGYAVGAILGDGQLSRVCVLLRVRDKDFAEAFASAVQRSLGWKQEPREETRKDGRYYVVNVYNVDMCRFLQEQSIVTTDWIRTQDIETKRGALKGLWDSEGNIQRKGRHRTVRFSNTDTAIIKLYRDLLLEVCGIQSLIYKEKRRKQHHKDIYRVCFGRHDDVVRFYVTVGTAIGRKAARFEEVLV